MARVFTRYNLRSGNPFQFLHSSTSSSPRFPHPHPPHKKLSLNLLNQILDGLEHCRTLAQLSQIHALQITSGCSHKPFFAAKLLKLSSEFGDLNYTLNIFRNINILDRICVNALIKAYSASSVAIQGVVFYFQMLKVGFSANSFTFPPLLNCCARRGCVVSGQKCHGQAVKRGFDHVLEIQNSLIHMYGCFRMIEMATPVFQEMQDRDLVSWHSIIGALCNAGDVLTAHHLFDEMPEKNVVSWNVLMTGYLENNMPGLVLKLFRQMLKEGFMGNARSIVSVLTASGKSARLKEGMSIHGLLIRRQWNMNLILHTALIDMYSKCRKVKDARHIFDGLKQKNLVCWNAMILGHCLHGNPQHGIDLFTEMMKKRVIPDAFTFTGVLCACTRAGQLDNGRDYFHQMVHEFCIKPNFAHYWCMANLLASNGLTEEAMETVRKVNEFSGDLSSESLVCATLLALCRFQGNTSPGERVAKSVIESEPQNIMGYALLFNVYAAAGRWNDVSTLKEMIRGRFAGRTPGCSLIDLIEIVHDFKLGKSNRVEMVMDLDELFQRQNLSCFLPPHFAQPEEAWCSKTGK